MKLCILIPHSLEIPALSQTWERELGHAQVLEAMRLADELGYCKATLGEHFLVPRPHLELSRAFWHHGSMALSAVAGATRQIGLSCTITILPLQHPIIQAKAWSTLDWFSGGRATAVVAPGWLEGEFDYLNVPFHERGKIMDEYVQAMLSLWYDENPAFEGQYVSFADAAFEPKPVKGKIPLWFGGDALPALKRVAKWGDGWAPFTTPPETFPQALDTIRSDQNYDGRTLGLHFPLAALRLGDGHVEREAEVAAGTWNVQQIVDTCGWLGRLGVTETVLPLPPLTDFAAYLDRLRWVAAEIMPKVATL